MGYKIDKILVKFLAMNDKGQEKMAKVVSSTEAKARLGSMLKWARDNQDNVIIEVHGEPEAVLISYAEYQFLEKLKEMHRRQEALSALRALRDEVTANTLELSDHEVYKLAGVSEGIAQKLIAQDHPTLPEKVCG
jgi:prevent-host-death family protein